MQKIELKEKLSSGATGTSNVLKDAAPDNADSPWAIRLGFSYAFPSGLEIPVSLKYSLWKALDAENERNETIVAVGFRFWLIERLELSLGVSFAGINRPKDILDETYFDPTLSSHHHRRWNWLENLR